MFAEPVDSSAKNCPFCGSLPVLERIVADYGDRVGYEIRCVNSECCINRDRLFDNSTKATEHWNKRVVN